MVVIDTISNSVHFPSQRKEISIVSLSLEVLEGEHEKHSSEEHVVSHHLIRSLVTNSSLHEIDEVRHIVSHLRSGCRSAIIVINQTILKLLSHT